MSTEEQILVRVELPAASRTFEVRIPVHAKAGEVAETLSGMLETLSDGLYRAGKEQVLIDKSSGRVLAQDAQIAALQIGNGARLILI